MLVTLILSTLALSPQGPAAAASTWRRENEAEILAEYRSLLRIPNHARNLGDILSSFDKVLIPELNMGQLRLLIRARYLVDAVGFNKVQGKPFLVSELMERMEQMLNDE